MACKIKFELPIFFVSKQAEVFCMLINQVQLVIYDSAPINRVGVKENCSTTLPWRWKKVLCQCVNECVYVYKCLWIRVRRQCIYSYIELVFYINSLVYILDIIILSVFCSKCS